MSIYLNKPREFAWRMTELFDLQILILTLELYISLNDNAEW